MPEPHQSPAFAELPPDLLPATIEFIRVDTGEVCQTLTIDGPGALRVEPWTEITGSPIRVRTTTADGVVHVVEPPTSA